MIAQPKSSFTEHFRSADNFSSGRICPDGELEFSMSEKEFQKMHQNFHFPIQLFHLFNDKFSAMVSNNIIII